MKYDLRKIMVRAWQIFRKYAVSFGEALRRSWAVTKAEPINAARVQMAAAAAGITAAVNTWSGWKSLGYEVAHGSKALFQVELIYASRGDGQVYKASFFSVDQVRAMA